MCILCFLVLPYSCNNNIQSRSEHWASSYTYTAVPASCSTSLPTPFCNCFAACGWFACVYSLHLHLNYWLITTLDQNFREIFLLICFNLIFYANYSEKGRFSKIILYYLKNNSNPFSFKNISYWKVVFFEDRRTIYLCYFLVKMN